MASFDNNETYFPYEKEGETMVRIVENDDKERRWMEWAISHMCRNGSEAFFVNAERISEKIVTMVQGTECPIVLYARGRWSALPDERKRLVFPLLSRNNVGTVFGYPFSLLELYHVYHALEEGSAVNNNFAVLAIRGSVIQKLRGLLATIRSEQEKIGAVCHIEKTFGIRVRESEIRKEIKEAAGIDAPSLAPPIPEVIVEGVFCDAEGSLFTHLNEVNNETVKSLYAYERDKKVVVLWTDGDIENAQNALSAKNIKNAEGKDYVVIYKRHYAGRRVELVIDSHPDMKAFQKKYRIFPERYIRK